MFIYVYIIYYCTLRLGTACVANYSIGFFENEQERNLKKRIIVVYSRGRGTVQLSSFGGTRKQTRNMEANVPLVFPIPTILPTYTLNVNSSHSVDVFGGSVGGGSSGAFAVYPGLEKQRSVYRYLAMSTKSIRHGFKSAIVIASISGSSTLISMRKMTDGRFQRKISLNVRNFPRYVVYDNGDLTGTEIVSSTPLAVYSGHQCAEVPAGRRYCDQIVEQIPPVSALGRRYIIAGFAGRTSNTVTFVKVLAAFNGTVVRINCTNSTTVNLDASDHHAFTIGSNEACYISATQPIMVVQFSIGMNTEIRGDPSMVVVPHLDDISDHASIYSLPQDTIMRHYITIITDQSTFDDDQLTIDGVSPPVVADVIRRSTDSDLGMFVVVRMQVGTGIHNVNALGGKCLVMAYGFAHSSGYSYASKMSPRYVSHVCVCVCVCVRACVRACVCACV